MIESSVKTTFMVYGTLQEYLRMLSIVEGSQTDSTYPCVGKNGTKVV